MNVKIGCLHLMFTHPKLGCFQLAFLVAGHLFLYFHFHFKERAQMEAIQALQLQTDAKHRRITSQVMKTVKSNAWLYMRINLCSPPNKNLKILLLTINTFI